MFALDGEVDADGVAAPVTLTAGVKQSIRGPKTPSSFVSSAFVAISWAVVEAPLQASGSIDQPWPKVFVEFGPVAVTSMYPSPTPQLATYDKPPSTPTAVSSLGHAKTGMDFAAMTEFWLTEESVNGTPKFQRS